LTLTIANRPAVADQRIAHQQAANDFFEQAQDQAHHGLISEAGLLILKGLAQERRARMSGPQVMQLIKPRI
jgi:hypothetical protein